MGSDSVTLIGAQFRPVVTAWVFRQRLRIIGASVRIGTCLCRDHALTPYDALYVELAQRSRWPLAFFDLA